MKTAQEVVEAEEEHVLAKETLLVIGNLETKGKNFISRRRIKNEKCLITSGLKSMLA